MQRLGRTRSDPPRRLTGSHRGPSSVCRPTEDWVVLECALVSARLPPPLLVSQIRPDDLLLRTQRGQSLERVDASMPAQRNSPLKKVCARDLSSRVPHVFLEESAKEGCPAQYCGRNRDRLEGAHRAQQSVEATLERLVRHARVAEARAAIVGRAERSAGCQHDAIRDRALEQHRDRTVAELP